MNYRVKVYTIDTPYSPFKDPHTTLASPNARQIGGALESPYVINAIKVSRLLGKEVLVSASENGEVCIWRTEHLDEAPMVLNNEIATWGIAIHADQGLVAVSANNKIITIYNILEMTRDNPIYGGSDNTGNLLGKELKIELVGHEHNIPNIDFSETGKYLASASIDQTCRVWDITTRKVVTQKKTPSVAHADEYDQW
ncbi:WD40-repeat-containing domain protein [Mucor mucedo]|uniref:WD40-repeat-containing domain protein n=1 Tax=Mucor mucedo TaxID=29922 RepID=UPI00221FD5D4|nr:WD40-repeat-containing domain protein [Mucor mucedo]KAI7867613.1 WD40-repeat-containing domain protein [Mucor mucedo]